MDQRITKFLKRHHVLTLSTQSEDGPWTAHCFYAFLEEEMALVFTTDEDTRHGQEMLANPVVSGGIVLETKVVGMVRGVQVVGKVEAPTGPRPDKSGQAFRGDDNHPKALGKRAKRAYLRRFPYAVGMKLNLWILYIDYLKMTDNRLGFGKKIVWERDSESPKAKGQRPK